SRRRHTRWPRDWSSDVCSSDLEIRLDQAAFPLYQQMTVYAHTHPPSGSDRQDGPSNEDLQLSNLQGNAYEYLFTSQGAFEFNHRSEERRVVKECRLKCVSVK